VIQRPITSGTAFPFRSQLLIAFARNLWMKWVGHKSPTTILRYYAKVKLEQKEHRQKATQAFDRFSAVGD
jgi:hypothetical protein